LNLPKTRRKLYINIVSLCGLIILSKYFNIVNIVKNISIVSDIRIIDFLNIF